MSAIGSFVVLRRDDFEKCLMVANSVASNAEQQAREVFLDSWSAAIGFEKFFSGSGYALGYFLDCQNAINDVFEHSQELDQTTEGKLLSRFFVAAFPFLEPTAPLPPLDGQKLHEYCLTEWPEAAHEMQAAIKEAERFFCTGLEHTDNAIVVFLIR